MSYFNHAFQKVFLGTKTTTAEAYNIGGVLTQAGINNGYITTSTKLQGDDVPIHTSDLQNYGMGPGTYAMFDPNTYLIQQQSGGNSPCCPLMLVSASLMTVDKIGQFHGGYQESTKSKIINPRYVTKFYYVPACSPRASVVSVGTTPYTIAETMTCEKEFLCGENYYLRIDLKGSPVLKALHHNAYMNLHAYTGCCTDPTPSGVDPTLVYIQWAEQIIRYPYLSAFVMPVVFDFEGTPWYAPGTTVTLDNPLSPTPVTSAQWWDAYAPSAPWNGENTGGLRLYGAFVDTKFGNCTFQTTDAYEIQPVRIYASEVDMNGDPCTFEGLCVNTECDGYQGEGYGETVLRDLILSESYLQNDVANDLRIREVTHGNDIVDAVSRTTMHGRYYIQHSVPRLMNASGIYDNDQYLLSIPVLGQSTPFETFMNNWLSCNGSLPDCVHLEVHTCSTCSIEPDTEV